MTQCAACNAPIPERRLLYSTRCIDCARNAPAPPARYTEAAYGFKGNGTCVIRISDRKAHADNVVTRG